MASLLEQFSPTVTNMIRFDHMHVLAAFHQYEVSESERVKRGLAENVCLALEIHAQLEEEIFYPAVRVVLDTEMLHKSVPEHDEARALVTRLRHMPAADPLFDQTFFELMRHVMHHVADEETQVLPAAERLLADQLTELGARMTRRRLELTAKRTPELASSMARSLSVGSVAAAGQLMAAGASLMTRHRPSGMPWLRPGMWRRTP